MGRLKRESNPASGYSPSLLPQHESSIAGVYLETGERNPLPTKVTGSFVRLSTEPKPTTGVQDGNDLLEVDTGKVFVYYSGSWREI